MHVLLHCNGGARIGVGHVLRSIALAEEALARGHRVTVAGTIEGDLLLRALASLNIVALPTSDIGRLIHDLAPDVVHIDTYDEVRLPVCRGTPLLSNMEDDEFGRRMCDLAIDPTIDAETSERLTTPRASVLRGARYAPLRRVVTRRRGRWARATTEGRVLVLMGGADPRDLSPAVVSALAALGRRITVTVVSPERLHTACLSAGRGLSLTLLADVDDLPALMVNQDLVVSAAGTSVLELCCLGLPMALVCAVENQRRGYERVIAHEAAIGLGVGGLDNHAVRTLGSLLDDASLRQSYGERAAALVDGRGAWRIITAWEQALSEPPESQAVALRRLQVREADIRDAEQLLDWRNDPDTRRFSRHPQIVSLSDHRQWLRNCVTDNARLLFVAGDGNGDVGTIRWDHRHEHTWEVSITVAPDRRGEGMARPLLAAGEQALVENTPGPLVAVAAVRTSNSASRRVFTQAGYLRETDPDADGFAQYVKTLSRRTG